MPQNDRVALDEAPNSAQLRALVDLMLSSETARSKRVRLHHAPEILARSPAKLEIMVNALLVFMDRGITQATVQDLLDAAKISRRTFYKYFRNKIDVLESLYKLAVDVMVLRYKADIGPVSTAREVAQRLVSVFFAYHRDLAPVIRMMQEESVRPDSPLAPHRAEAMEMVAGLVNDELLRISGKRIDPLFIRSIMWAMESLSIELLRNRKSGAAAIDRGQQVMTAIAEVSFERALQGSP